MDEKCGIEEAKSLFNALIGNPDAKSRSKDVGLSERIMLKWFSEKAI